MKECVGSVGEVLFTMLVKQNKYNSLLTHLILDAKYLSPAASKIANVYTRIRFDKTLTIFCQNLAYVKRKQP